MPGPRRAPARVDLFDAPARDEAVDMLFRRHYEELLRLAYCLLGDRSQAEDAVQDAFVSVFAHWGGLHDVAAAPGYLRASVINRCRSSVRARVRARRRGDGAMGPVGVSVASSEEAALAMDERTRVIRALHRLPSRQREAVVCRYYLEFSVAQTAEVLQITQGSVKRHTHRGLKALSAHLGEEAS